MAADTEIKATGGVGEPQHHDSAFLHVSGNARYTDDLPEPTNLLHIALGISHHAHAEIEDIDLQPVLAVEGVVDVLVAADIPGKNNYGPVLDDDPLLSANLVQYAGQPIFAVIAEDVSTARQAVDLAVISYRELEPVLDARTAVAKKSFVLPSKHVVVGNPVEALTQAPRQLSGQTSVGGQDQFYLEGQIAMAVPGEDNNMLVYCSTQHPSEIQHVVAQILKRNSNDVMVECRRMGGGFGGKESQPALLAGIAALAAQKTGRPAKLRLDRDVDMIVTGKRHDFAIDYTAGYSDTGEISVLQLSLASRCGMSADLSGAINDRAMFHCDNAYYLPNADITSHRCKTNTVSNTAFRGFGGPQGMFAIEYVIDDISRALSLDPVDVRRSNFYGINERNITPYKQVIKDNIIHQIFDSLEDSSDYRARRSEIQAFNNKNTQLKRGIAMTPVKFGISFTTTHLNQAGALIHIYNDGTVYLNHGGTEMGQGLFTKVAQVVAHIFQIDMEKIKISATDTAKVPNTSATAASSGSDLNGQAAADAANKIKKRLTKFAAEHFGTDTSSVEFTNNHVKVGSQVLTFNELIKLAYEARTSLSATGFYATPDIHFDQEQFAGQPFYYFAYGAAVSEVVVDLLTGENRLLRADILHDCGKSLNPAIDLGQIEGGFIQGVGWLTTEELHWDTDGILKTHAPSTYKIPTIGDAPVDFRVNILESAENQQETIYRSKAVGEPPLMLALSTFFALRDAIATPANTHPPLAAPATPEAILTASRPEAAP
ncbi:MAG: xanthine dehydrogenase molybdopterin binding subunit [Pseudomonadaceae bacterium]|nr:xanthine dehydrogenase molybdopterin binding subunit [Pseudomonadaceae bacterium]